jgi:hypothetical protein
MMMARLRSILASTGLGAFVLFVIACVLAAMGALGDYTSTLFAMAAVVALFAMIRR